MADDLSRIKISELNQVSNNSSGFPNINQEDMFEVSEPSGESWESKYITVEQLQKYVFDVAFPVGSIYMSTSSTSPQTIFGGTWEAFAQGRCIFGVDTSKRDAKSGTDDWNYNNIWGWSEKPDGTLNTGGNESGTVTMTESTMPAHTHTVVTNTKLDTGVVEFQVRHPYDPNNNITPSLYLRKGDGVVTGRTSEDNLGGDDHKWAAGTVTKTQPSDDKKKGDLVSIQMPGLQSKVGVTTTGSGNPINILPPYVVCYVWRRTA